MLRRVLHRFTSVRVRQVRRLPLGACSAWHLLCRPAASTDGAHCCTFQPLAPRRASCSQLLVRCAVLAGRVAAPCPVQLCPSPAALRPYAPAGAIRPQGASTSPRVHVWCRTLSPCTAQGLRQVVHTPTRRVAIWRGEATPSLRRPLSAVAPPTLNPANADADALSLLTALCLPACGPSASPVRALQGVGSPAHVNPPSPKRAVRPRHGVCRRQCAASSRGSSAKARSTMLVCL